MGLLNKTLSLSEKTTATNAEIADHLGVTVRWYQKVIAGDINDPGVRKIQKLHDYLVEVAEKKAA